MKQKISYSMLFCLILVAGCAGREEGPAMYTVAGIVNLDGKPLPNGNVSFVPKDGQGGSYGTEVVDGKFTMKSSAGDKIVAISSYRLSATLIGPDGKPGPEQYLPVRYNKKTTLEKQVTTDKEQTMTFDLTSKP